jgi:regulator of nonsense transcripts 1
MVNGKMAQITRVVPVETLVIDEASQIDVGDYLPVIHRHQSKLQKLVFIGDDKQRASIPHISGISDLTISNPYSGTLWL